MKIKLFLILTASLLLSTSVFAQKMTSVYTSLNDKKCKTLESNVNEGGSYLGECAGTSGYKLQISEGDLRQSVNVIAPNKKSFNLGLGRVSSAFSAVGERAEWRVKGKTPMALIVRFNASENPDDTNKMTSYLIVSKITKNEVCIVDVFKPGKSQNLLAQKSADSAIGKPCKTFE